MSAFWGAWNDAAANPGDLSTRSAVLQQADSLTRSLKGIATSLGDLRGQLGDDATTLVAQVNADSARVAELNGSIVASGLGFRGGRGERGQDAERYCAQSRTRAGCRRRAW